MFIQTEQTPNPATLKFLPGCAVMPRGTADFPSAEAAAPSPLARRLFAVEGVRGVFLGGDFVSVSKAEDQDWALLKPQVLAAMMDHFTSGGAVIEDAALASSEGEGEVEGEDGEIIARILELLDQKVRPAVAQDGGDITFQGFHEGVVYLNMQGSCSGCPSSTATLKVGIENLLKYYIPEVREVRPANG